MRAVQSRRRAWPSVMLGAFSREDLRRVPITRLVPTQMTVGMQEVGHKRRRWRERSACEAADFLKMLRIPVVLGPGTRPYLLDRHHLALALHNEGVKELFVSITSDMSHLPRDEFWMCLENQNWAHPFDVHGRPRPYNDMPETLDGLQDDPFRSLSWAVKKAGGFTKDEAPFSEFRWADFFRSRIPLELVKRDFARALALAMHFARRAEAAALPGWRASEHATIAFPYWDQQGEMRHLEAKQLGSATNSRVDTHP
jgi:hypothetical protein